MISWHTKVIFKVFSSSYSIHSSFHYIKVIFKVFSSSYSIHSSHYGILTKNFCISRLWRLCLHFYFYIKSDKTQQVFGLLRCMAYSYCFNVTDSSDEFVLYWYYCFSCGEN
jgi:hypothetical protein